MHFKVLPILALAVVVFACSERDEPKAPIVETLEVVDNSSSSRKFRGSLEHIETTDTIKGYGFEWQSRYGTWEVKKSGSLSKGVFHIRDHTQLSKWSTFTVRAFIETQNGIIYGDVESFATEKD